MQVNQTQPWLSARQGTTTWNATRKKRKVNISILPPIRPESDLELQVAAKSIAFARRAMGAAGSRKMYVHAQQLYEGEVNAAYMNERVAAPPALRFAPTTASALQALDEGCARRRLDNDRARAQLGTLPQFTTECVGESTAAASPSAPPSRHSAYQHAGQIIPISEVDALAADVRLAEVGHSTGFKYPGPRVKATAKVYGVAYKTTSTHKLADVRAALHGAMMQRRG